MKSKKNIKKNLFQLCIYNIYFIYKKKLTINSDPSIAAKPYTIISQTEYT